MRLRATRPSAPTGVPAFVAWRNRSMVWPRPGEGGSVHFFRGSGSWGSPNASQTRASSRSPKMSTVSLNVSSW
eukprot:3122472-Pleurochrysis_carterae.AAC.1